LRISRRRHKFQPKIEEKTHRANLQIKVPQVRLIDEAGANLGVMDTSAALRLALERGLDLVEVSPLANPPVVKIVDYNKLKYQEEKERHKERAKAKKIEVKGIRLTLRIGAHDREVRLKQAEEFLKDGDKVKVEMILRGRENQHAVLAKEIVNKFVASINSLIPITVESPLAYQGGRIGVLVARQ